MNRPKSTPAAYLMLLLFNYGTNTGGNSSPATGIDNINHGAGLDEVTGFYTGVCRCMLMLFLLLCFMFMLFFLSFLMLMLFLLLCFMMCYS